MTMRRFKAHIEGHEMKRKEIDSYVYSAIGNYGISALMFALDRCIIGGKAHAQYPEEPMIAKQEVLQGKEEKREKEQEESILFMQLQIKAANRRLQEAREGG